MKRIAQTDCAGASGKAKQILDPIRSNFRLVLKPVRMLFALASLLFTQQTFSAENYQVTYHTAKVHGLNLFYREAGNPSRPTIVLLHGFPSSSHMYRNLIPKLALNYHVVGQIIRASVILIIRRRQSSATHSTISRRSSMVCSPR